MKKSTNIRYRNSWFDFCGDGVFSKERIKGEDKRRLGKWSRKKMAKESEMDYEEEEKMIIIEGKEIYTMKEAYEWLREAWTYEPFNIWYEEFGKPDSDFYEECINVEPVRGHEDMGSYAIYSLEEFERFLCEH